MPLLNGVKMACEPCIRGHRSTKCTHANERLMVPVRKPGRPLSSCPHPRDQSCACESVTAAIPRKQNCHCGNKPTQNGSPTVSKSTNPSTEPMSPTRKEFKVSKQRSFPNKRPSVDVANLERMDLSQVNVVSFDRQLSTPSSLSKGYTHSEGQQTYGYAPQYPSMQPQFPQFPVQSPLHTNGIDDTMRYSNGKNGSTNGGYNERNTMIESPATCPALYMNGDSNKITNGVSHPNGGSKSTANGGSCCVPKQNGHSQSSSSSSFSVPAEPPVKSCCAPSQPKAETSNCCAPKSQPHHLKQEPLATVLMPQTLHQALPSSNMPFSQTPFTSHGPPTTVFTYPPTYGSFQNPLQPFSWRESVRTNTYSQPSPNQVAFNVPFMSETMDTVHTCSCGDTCQCIGCAAHPYNNATQDYVRSAYASMAAEQQPFNPTTLPHSTSTTSKTNNHKHQPSAGSVEGVSSSAPQTPASTTPSANGDTHEQSLSSSDFFFVSYPFHEMQDGCGGDTMSCPCGDDCQCLGCTIHGNGVSLPGLSSDANSGIGGEMGNGCCGEEGGCPCGVDCQCIGCEWHKNVNVDPNDVQTVGENAVGKMNANGSSTISGHSIVHGKSTRGSCCG